MMKMRISSEQGRPNRIRLLRGPRFADRLSDESTVVDCRPGRIRSAGGKYALLGMIQLKTVVAEVKW